MNNVIYEYQIPDPDRPIPKDQRGACGPSGVLVPFAPEPLAPGDVIGRQIDAFENAVGTYGMGGVGFFGLRLGCDWLVVAIRGADEWIHADDRLVADWDYEEHGRPKPWFAEEYEDFAELIVGREIESIHVARHSLGISIADGPDLVIEESSQRRPPLSYPKGQQRAFSSEDDLRRAVFLAPTAEIWVLE